MRWWLDRLDRWQAHETDFMKLRQLAGITRQEVATLCAAWCRPAVGVRLTYGQPACATDMPETGHKKRCLRHKADVRRVHEVSGMDWLDFMQWPAMVVTVLASWFVASSSKGRRNSGFWLFLVSNVLWVVWAVDQRAYALIVLQVALAAMNIRGARKTDTASAKS
ncbi:MAG TPA: hypothetical protein VGD25_00955 [Immundisolibacter sp.]